MIKLFLDCHDHHKDFYRGTSTNVTLWFRVINKMMNRKFRNSHLTKTNELGGCADMEPGPKERITKKTKDKNI
jgi:hypothetical protein